MNQNKFLKVFCFIAFIAFMLTSCWATVESLHLLLPNWPIFIFWTLTIGIFFLASVGSKLIVDSFSPSDFVPNKGWRLIGGCIMLLVFWVLFSLPTNTHTFFYKSVAKEVMQQETVFLKNRMSALIDTIGTKNNLESQKEAFRTKVNAAFERVHFEIMDPNNKGYGPRTEEAIRNLTNILGDNVEFQKPRYINTHKGQLNCSDNLRAQKDKYLNLKLNEMDKQLDREVLKLNKQIDIKENVKRLTKLQNKLLAGADKFINPNNNEFKQAKGDLNFALSILKRNPESILDLVKEGYLTFTKSSEKNSRGLNQNEIQTESIVSKTQKLESVIDVWKDYFSGKYDGRGFIFWIIIAALVDIAGFIFFDITFKRNR